MTLPVGTIKTQISGTDPLAGCPVVMVDDPGYTVDDSRACVGSISVLTPMKPAKVTPPRPRGQ